MKIIIIDDDFFKREQITDYLKELKIEYETFLYTNPALRYIVKNKENISGIILDMGLQSYEDSHDYSVTKGMNIINELNRKKINIPILINSSRDISMFNKHPFVFGQRSKIDDYQILDDYISFLKQREGR